MASKGVLKFQGVLLEFLWGIQGKNAERVLFRKVLGRRDRGKGCAALDTLEGVVLQTLLKFLNLFLSFGFNFVFQCRHIVGLQNESR